MMAEGERRMTEHEDRRRMATAKASMYQGDVAWLGGQAGRAPTCGFIAGQELSPLASGRSDGGGVKILQHV